MHVDSEAILHVTIRRSRDEGRELAVEEIGIDHLLEELQRLPLAVSQAGAYVRQKSMIIKKYRRKSMDLLKVNNFNRG